jgi:hypothetical protein
MTLMLFLRAWVKMIHEENLKQKYCDNVPLIVENIEAYLNLTRRNVVNIVPTYRYVEITACIQPL